MVQTLTRPNVDANDAGRPRSAYRDAEFGCRN
jgi:hypothetical protein